MKKILLIDDDQDICEMVSIILGSQYEVAVQNDTVGLEERLLSFNPDLVLLDNSVVQNYKADIMQTLKGPDEQDSVPVVLFSAHANIIQIAAKMNANAYIAKPFNLVELYSCIDRLIA